jgi:diguanylate cyclase
MQKDELKSLVTQMYEELLATIDSEKNATKDQVVEFLENASVSIAAINETELDSTEHAKTAFTNAYKEIAKKSLSSYKNTNCRFEELTLMQQETISECADNHIDFPSIKDKFDEIQAHMNDEVKKANQIITKLTKQVQELEESSNLDPLTKVFNRRALTSYLSKICEKKEISHEFHLLILDIDDFKQVNDTYGHIAGDKILIFIANILRKTLRDGDKVFRYGGEEFVITLNRIDSATCYDISSRILKLINSNKLIYKGSSLNVTMSIGATKFHTGDTPEAIINRADIALYRSKKNGKNQMNTEIKDGN